MSEELKPCPFCGGKRAVTVVDDEAEERFGVKCFDCGGMIDAEKDTLQAVHKSILDFFDICDDDEESPMTYKDERLLEVNKVITTRIKAVPSAEPEIVRCKDCKYRDENWRRVSVRWLPCMDVRTGSNWYCGSAEGRTDE